MSNQPETQAGSKIDSSGRDNAVHSPVFLDRPFFSLFGMGLLIAILVILSALSGWKIVHLEQERATLVEERTSIIKDREQLNEERKTYSEILAQLPELKIQRQDAETKLVELNTKVGVAESKIKALDGEIAVAESKQQQLLDKSDDLHGQVIANQKKITDLNKDQADLFQKNTDIANTSSELEKRRDAFRQEASDEETRLASLKEEVNLLEKRRSELDTAINTLTGSESILADLPRRLTELTKQLDGIENDVTKTSNSFYTSAGHVADDIKKLGEATQRSGETSAALKASWKNIFSEVDSLTKNLDVKQTNLGNVITSFGTTVDNLDNKLTPAIEGVNGKIGQLEEITSRLDEQEKNITAHVASIEKSELSLSSIELKLKNIGDSLKAYQQDIDITLEKISDDSAQLEPLPKELIKSNKTISEASGATIAASMELEKVTKDLGEIVVGLGTLRREMDGVVKRSESELGIAPQSPPSQKSHPAADQNADKQRKP